MWDAIWFLAQSTQSSRPPSPLGSMLLPLLVVVAIMYFILWRPESRRRKERQAMLKQIRKNDRVVTTGGIIGTIMDVKDDEIVLKIDESTNTKIRVNRWAIHDVLKD